MYRLVTEAPVRVGMTGLHKLRRWLKASPGCTHDAVRTLPSKVSAVTTVEPLFAQIISSSEQQTIFANFHKILKLRALVVLINSVNSDIIRG